MLPIRAIHLDLKGMPPTCQRLCTLLPLFSAAGYNALLVEWEDCFPWRVDERFRGPFAYAEEEIAHLMASARAAGMEIIPLVQCLGHQETPLSIPGYESLREIPDDPSVLNPLAPGARALVEGMVEDVLRLIPDVTHFHLGGDEAWTFGSHPDTKAHISRNGKASLYLHHVEPILQMLNQKEIRPLLWHDMMVDWEGSQLRVLAELADLVTWGYAGHPDTTDEHYRIENVERLHEHGFTLWAGTSFKGAGGQNMDLPVVEDRLENALAWTEVAGRHGYAGIIATGWSRYATHKVICCPLEGALDSMIQVGEVLKTGSIGRDGDQLARTVLAKAGEWEHFAACKRALGQLTELRTKGWRFIRNLREVMSAHSLAAQAPMNLFARHLARLEQAMEEAQAICSQVRDSLFGCVNKDAVEGFLNSRILPLEDEHRLLKSELTERMPDRKFCFQKDACGSVPIRQDILLNA